MVERVHRAFWDIGDPRAISSVVRGVQQVHVARKMHHVYHAGMGTGAYNVAICAARGVYQAFVIRLMDPAHRAMMAFGMTCVTISVMLTALNHHVTNQVGHV